MGTKEKKKKKKREGEGSRGKTISNWKGKVGWGFIKYPLLERWGWSTGKENGMGKGWRRFDGNYSSDFGNIFLQGGLGLENE